MSARFYEVDEVLSAFVRGQLTVGAILSVIYAAGFSAARIQMAVVIGLITGLGNMVPYKYLLRQGHPLPKPRPKFAHAAEFRVASGPVILGCYHVSQQNTQTGKLTPKMFDAILVRARELQAT